MPAFYYWRSSIADGTYQHPQRKWSLDVDADRRAAWETNFRRLRAAGIEIPILADHKSAAAATLGYVIDIRQQGTWLQELHQYLGTEARDIALRNRVSVAVSPDFVDSTGNHFGEAIVHSAIVPHPLVPGQQPPIPASMAAAMAPPIAAPIAAPTATTITASLATSSLVATHSDSPVETDESTSLTSGSVSTESLLAASALTQAIDLIHLSSDSTAFAPDSTDVESSSSASTVVCEAQLQNMIDPQDQYPSDTHPQLAIPAYPLSEALAAAPLINCDAGLDSGADPTTGPIPATIANMDDGPLASPQFHPRLHSHLHPRLHPQAQLDHLLFTGHITPAAHDRFRAIITAVDAAEPAFHLSLNGQSHSLPDAILQALQANAPFNFAPQTSIQALPRAIPGNPDIDDSAAINFGRARAARMNP